MRSMIVLPLLFNLAFGLTLDEYENIRDIIFETVRNGDNYNANNYATLLRTGNIRNCKFYNK